MPSSDPTENFLCDCQLGSKGNAEDRIMSTTNFSSSGSHTKSFHFHKCGKTSRPDVGTEIQTNCNFEAHVYYFNYLLGF